MLLLFWNDFERKPDASVLLDVFNHRLKGSFRQGGFIEFDLYRRLFDALFERAGSAKCNACVLSHTCCLARLFPVRQTKSKIFFDSVSRCTYNGKHEHES